jgi:hypothetical protein
MHHLKTFKEVLDHVTSGGRAYIVADAPLNYIQGTSNGVMWGEENTSNGSLIPAPLQHCIWGARYVVFEDVKPVLISEYKDYICVKASNSTTTTTLYTVFDENNNKVHEGDELHGVFSLEQWVEDKEHFVLKKCSSLW